MAPPPNSLPWSPADFDFLMPHLPPASPSSSSSPTPPLTPHLTLTFATSLDSMLSIHPGVQTYLSCPESKSMTHFLRSKHDGILIGVGTAVADDPGLNCRLEGAEGYSSTPPVGSADWPGTEEGKQREGEARLQWQPRPIVLDPTGRWGVSPESKVLRLVSEGRALAPWVITDLAYVDDARAELLEGYGGAVIPLASVDASVGGDGEGRGLRFEWPDVLTTLASHGLRSVMVEGGAGVVNGLLRAENQRWVDAVVVTVAPRWLGRGGTVVSPERGEADDAAGGVAALRGAKWVQMGEDVVVCGKLGG